MYKKTTSLAKIAVLFILTLLGIMFIGQKTERSPAETLHELQVTGCQKHRDIIANSCKSCLNGYCFLGKCFCSTGFTGDACDHQTSPLPNTCEKDQCFFTPELGVPMVNTERWSRSQSQEANLWNTCKDCEDDGWIHHGQGFNFYKSITYPVGNYIEIGCGPFTQSLGVFGKFRPDLKHALNSLALLDPNVFDYVQHVEKNTYRDGTLLGMKVVLIGGPSEQFPICEFYDTLLVINVAEHVQNIFKHFETIYHALKDNGQLIFHDRAWPGYDPIERYQSNHLDWTYHPTRTKEPVFEHFLSFFEPEYCETFITNDELNPRAYYFIGRKRSRQNVWTEAYEGYMTKLPKFTCTETKLDVVRARKFE